LSRKRFARHIESGECAATLRAFAASTSAVQETQNFANGKPEGMPGQKNFSAASRRRCSKLARQPVGQGQDAKTGDADHQHPLVAIVAAQAGEGEPGEAGIGQMGKGINQLTHDGDFLN
jgi:hypothetical protein